MRFSSHQISSTPRPMEKGRCAMGAVRKPRPTLSEDTAGRSRIWRTNDAARCGGRWDEHRQPGQGKSAAHPEMRHWPGTVCSDLVL
jgi:hypothetical protein